MPLKKGELSFTLSCTQEMLEFLHIIGAWLLCDSSKSIMLPYKDLVREIWNTGSSMLIEFRDRNFFFSQFGAPISRFRKATMLKEVHPNQHIVSVPIVFKGCVSLCASAQNLTMNSIVVLVDVCAN